jgi:hypothetical protein
LYLTFHYQATMKSNSVLNQRVKSSVTTAAGKELGQFLNKLRKRVLKCQARNAKPEFHRELGRITRHKVKGAQLKELRQLKRELAKCCANSMAVKVFGANNPALPVPLPVDQPQLSLIPASVEAEYVIPCAKFICRDQVNPRGVSFWRVKVGRCDIKLSKLFPESESDMSTLGDVSNANWPAEHPECEWRQVKRVFVARANGCPLRVLNAGEKLLKGEELAVTEEYGASDPLLEDGVFLRPSVRAEINAHLEPLAVNNFCTISTFDAMHNFLIAMKRLNRYDFQATNDPQ